jgi:alpha-beta hydrolase superfamily lysophospholipase
MSPKNEFWHVYYDDDVIERSKILRQNFMIDAASAHINVDAYLQADPNAPVILLNHGEASYARLMVPVALALFDRGYSVLAPDQRGHGFSNGESEDYTLEHLTQDLLNSAHWSRRMVSGPLIIAGVNQGSGLAYAATGMGAPVIGMILHHLYDFSSLEAILSTSRFSVLASLPGGSHLAGGLARALMAVAPGLRLSYDSLTRFNDYLDERDNGNQEAWMEDPLFSRTISLRHAVSTFSTPPPVPFEENALPALVINPIRDTLFDPEITRRGFERLGGSKTYSEIDFGHWSLGQMFAEEWAQIVDGWVQNLLAR